MPVNCEASNNGSNRCLVTFSHVSTHPPSPTPPRTRSWCIFLCARQKGKNIPEVCGGRPVNMNIYSVCKAPLYFLAQLYRPQYIVYRIYRGSTTASYKLPSVATKPDYFYNLNLMLLTCLH